MCRPFLKSEMNSDFIESKLRNFLPRSFRLLHSRPSQPPFVTVKIVALGVPRNCMRRVNALRIDQLSRFDRWTKTLPVHGVGNSILSRISRRLREQTGNTFSLFTLFRRPVIVPIFSSYKRVHTAVHNNEWSDVVNESHRIASIV